MGAAGGGTTGGIGVLGGVGGTFFYLYFIAIIFLMAIMNYLYLLCLIHHDKYNGYRKQVIIQKILKINFSRVFEKQHVAD